VPCPVADSGPGTPDHDGADSTGGRPESHPYLVGLVVHFETYISNIFSSWPGASSTGFSKGISLGFLGFSTQERHR